ncbi:fatty acid desaturase family protein [Eleftheria terrae]|uniref:fatty acid desaturase family protein n=1 Tax=Eleftheria terrae TaxID=1597781 RepID=UPI00263A764D|nr:fatty acid desaturase family protein [Eleftheria terrae]WKB55705.1 fatty acid desaturase family protein [Eleftheria terrae]
MFRCSSSFQAPTGLRPYPLVWRCFAPALSPGLAAVSLPALRRRRRSVPLPASASVPMAARRRLANHAFSPQILAQLKVLSQSDNWHGLLAVLADYLVIALAVAAGQLVNWLYPLAVLVIGARQRALASILHDAAHGRAARHRWLNRLLGSQLSGYLILQAFAPYRQSHVIYHHGHLGDERLDPDYRLYIEDGLYHGMTRSRFFWREVLATALLLRAPAYLAYLVRHRSAMLLRHKTEFASMALLWGAILLAVDQVDGWSLLLLYWVVPFLTSFLVIGRFIEIAEHYPLLGQGNPGTILHGARNRFSHRLEAWFFSLHSEHLHLVHHLRPDIPFWNVGKAHQVMLQDPEYARVNREFGGIFLSSNDRPALVPALLRGGIALPGDAPSPSAPAGLSIDPLNGVASHHPIPDPSLGPGRSTS